MPNKSLKYDDHIMNILHNKIIKNKKLTKKEAEIWIMFNQVMAIHIIKKVIPLFKKNVK